MPDSGLAFGVHVFLKGALVLALAWTVNSALIRASAAVRHLIWSLAFAGLLVLPFVSWIVPAWTLPIPKELVSSRETAYLESTSPSPPETVVMEPPPALRETSSSTGERIAQKMRPATFPSASPLSQGSWQTAMAFVWLSGSSLFLLRLLVGFFLTRVEVQRAQPVTDEGWNRLLADLIHLLGIEQEVRLRQTDRSMVPITCGILRPKVLLPRGAEEWSAERRRSVLLHELGHVKRRDCLTQIAAQIACSLYWWNPLAWYAVRKHRQESERACDDVVLDLGTRASDYAHDLLEMARALSTTPHSPLASVALAHRSRFEERLLAVLDPKLARHALSRLSILAATLIAVLLVLPLAAVQPTARAEEPIETSVVFHPAPSPFSLEELAFDPSPSPAETESLSTATPTPQPQEEPVVSAEPEEKPIFNERALAALMEALHDPDASVRGQAVSLLGRMRYEPATDPFIDLALNDEDADVRQQAAWALGMIRASSAAETLVRVLQDSDPDVREQAAWALGMVQDGNTVDALMQTLLEDEDADVREQAAWALGMIREKRSVDALSKALTDEDPDVKEQAVWALGMLRASESVDALMGALRDEDAEVREQAAWALGIIQEDRATEALAAALRDEDADVREQTAWALGMLRSKAAVGALIEALGDEDSDVREQVAWALGMIRDERAIDALQAAMKDEDPDVREQAAWALGMLAWQEEDSS